MKVKSGTLLANALLATTTGAAGVAIGPAFFGDIAARAMPGVQLVTSIQVLPRAPEGLRYAVSVRPVGGPAHAATLVLSTGGPAVWTAAAPGCLSSMDRSALACDLGDLRQEETRTLNVTAQPGDTGPARVPVTAQAGAANAPSATVTLGATHPSALRLAHPVSGEPSPGVSSAGLDTSPAPDASPAPEASVVESLPEPSPSAIGSSDDPADAVAPEARAPWSARAVRPRAVHPPRPAPAPPRPTPRPPTPAASAEPAVPPAGGPAQPPAPRAPIIPHVPLDPGVPAAPAGVPPIGGPALPLPTMSVPVMPPKAAPQPASGEGVSELNTISPAGAMQAGRTSWATLIAIAVVTEAGLLWLVAGLTVMRRRRRGTGHHGSRRRATGPLLSRLLP